MEAAIRPDPRTAERAAAPPPRRPLPGLGWAALLLVALLAGCSPVRTVEAASLLADIARLHEARPVARDEVVYPGAERPRRAHLYRPQRPRAALVLVPGAAERALDDPRLIGFADALRRRGFLVLVPELAGPDPLMISAADADAVADAVRYLAEHAPFDEVGLVALSYAVGPTILAALEEGIRGDIGFVLSIGGYHDIVAAVTYITTGAFRARPGAAWRTVPVDARAKWLFLRANALRVDDPADARLLQAIARKRLDDPDADTAALAATLGAGGRAVYRLLVNLDADRVPALVAALPPRLRSEILALDLAPRDLTRLGGDLVLIHGRGDPMVPYTESLALARAARPGSASLYLLDGLDHVDLGAFGPGDVATLLRAAYRVLSERGGAASLSGARPASPRSGFALPSR
jgi:fermentation-respiration switch protein FrsA (DUF1100 family)